MESLERWMLKHLENDDIVDIYNHGANQGWPLIYKETCALYEQFHEEIWDIVEQVAEREFSKVLRLLSIKYPSINTARDFERAMVWMALEYLAEKIVKED